MQTFRKVEGKSGLVSSQIVDMKNQFLREILLVTPHYPSNTGIHKPILVATYVDALHQGQPKVPHKVWVQKRRYKSSTCSVYVDGNVPPVPIKHAPSINPSWRKVANDAYFHLRDFKLRDPNWVQKLCN